MGFGVGDRVSLLMKDGAVFNGTILFIHDDYVVLTPGLGYALDSIERIEAESDVLET
jgi:hypothetical protein